MPITNLLHSSVINMLPKNVALMNGSHIASSVTTQTHAVRVSLKQTIC